VQINFFEPIYAKFADRLTIVRFQFYDMQSTIPKRATADVSNPDAKALAYWFV